jgi:dye decolorizing peroxidase
MDRRSFIGMGLTGAAGVAVGATGTLAWTKLGEISAEGTVGNATVPFYGEHQPGIELHQAAHATLVAFRLRANTDAERLGRLLRLWSDDAALLQSGRPTLADSNPELSRTPASLTITIGLGFGAFAAAKFTEQWPLTHRAIPAFDTDRLDARWSGGDLLLQISANDGATVVHALRELAKDAQPFAERVWQQSGWHVQPDVNPGESPRNLFGFKEGAGNPTPGTSKFATTVWNDGSKHQWFAGGTSMVIRRIRTDLDLWDQVPPLMQETVFGRHVINGAPLGGTSEFQKPNFTARTAGGALVIATDAHIRLAESPSNIFRRPYNYDDGLTEAGVQDLGLLFIAYGAEIEQYLGIQSALASGDALNRWTAAVGSALFVIPPGARQAGGWVGDTLFQS